MLRLPFLCRQGQAEWGADEAADAISQEQAGAGPARQPAGGLHTQAGAAGGPDTDPTGQGFL